MAKQKDDYADDEFWEMRRTIFKREGWAILGLFALYIFFIIIKFDIPLFLYVVMVWVPTLLFQIARANGRRSKALAQLKK